MKVSVIGAGSWGTTLAAVLSEKLERVILWARREELTKEINERRTNSTYLPGIVLPESIFATSKMDEAVSEADIIIVAVPSKYFRQVCELAAGYVRRTARFLSVTKGIEANTLKRMSEVIMEVFKAKSSQVAVLSGPNHAEEVIRKIPSATVVASTDIELAKAIQELLMREYFRVYTHDDVVGVEIAGTVKNVLAIAVGISDGIGFGDNTRAALITRGLAEMVRLGRKMNANPLTFLGLSGIGDLIATATSKHSRNRNFGEAIGRGENLSDVLSASKMFVEGVVNAKSVMKLAQRYNVEMPICKEVYEIVYEGKNPSKSVLSLMLRSPKPEIEME